MSNLNRRVFLTGSLSAAALWSKTNRIDRSRLSAISDEVATSPAEAVAFAKKYGLQWLELRNVPGGKANYFYMPKEELRIAAKEFADNGVKISFLNTNLLKFGLPGTDPLRRRTEAADVREKRIAREQSEFDNRMQNLARCIESAHILNTQLIRVFTFLRVQEAAKLYQRIADVLGEMAKLAEREGVRLLIENEGACNVTSCSELSAMLNLLPSRAIGCNWDALNGTAQKEIPFPDGYQLLPKQRILNVQVKGKSILKKPEHLDWAPILKALEKDGYGGQIGLETHYFDGTNLEKSHASMQEMLRIVETT